MQKFYKAADSSNKICGDINKDNAILPEHSISTAYNRKFSHGIDTKKYHPVCPICGLRLWKDNAMNNMHIDSCLKKQNSKKRKHSSINLSCNDGISNKFSSSTDSHLLSRESSSNDDILTISSKYSHCVTSHGNDNMKGIVEKPVCPICSITLWNDLSLNNMHIDSCLSKDFASVNKRTSVSHKFTEDITGIDKDIIIRTVADLPGLYLIEDYITKEEEKAILENLNNDNVTPWKHSTFNGHCMSKCFGVKTQFGLPSEQRLVRENDVNSGEQDIPPYLQDITNRLQQLSRIRKDSIPAELRTFKANDCNANHYIRAQGHYLRPHFDDRALSGPLLVNLSLGGTVRMTYTKPNTSISIAVRLPPRCLQLVTGSARWYYMHEIKKEDILSDDRYSVTWRQSGGKKKIAQKQASNGEDITSLILKRHTNASNT